MGRQCPEVPGIALMKERPKKKKSLGNGMQKQKQYLQYLSGRVKFHVIWCLIFKDILEETHIGKVNEQGKGLGELTIVHNQTHFAPCFKSSLFTFYMSNFLRVPAQKSCNSTEFLLKNRIFSFALCIRAFLIKRLGEPTAIGTFPHP